MKGHTTGNKPRRDFLSILLGVWGILTLVPVLNVILRFVTPKQSSVVRQTMNVGSVSDIAPGTAKIIRFGKEPVIVVHTSSRQFKAFFARCTHLGCVVKFVGEGTQRFHCNCHGSEFDLTGKNLGGPAPRPLTPLKVNIEASALFVSSLEA